MIRKILSIMTIFIVCINVSSPFIVLEALDIDDTYFEILSEEDLKLNEDGDYTLSFDFAANQKIKYSIFNDVNNYNYYMDGKLVKPLVEGDYTTTGDNQNLLISARDGIDEKPEFSIYIKQKPLLYETSLSDNALTSAMLNITIDNFEEFNNVYLKINVNDKNIKVNETDFQIESESTSYLLEKESNIDSQIEVSISYDYLGNSFETEKEVIDIPKGEQNEKVLEAKSNANDYISEEETGDIILSDSKSDSLDNATEQINLVGLNQYLIDILDIRVYSEEEFIIGNIGFTSTGTIVEGDQTTYEGFHTIEYTYKNDNQLASGDAILEITDTDELITYELVANNDIQVPLGTTDEELLNLLSPISSIKVDGEMDSFSYNQTSLSSASYYNLDIEGEYNILLESSTRIQSSGRVWTMVDFEEFSIEVVNDGITGSQVEIDGDDSFSIRPTLSWDELKNTNITASSKDGSDTEVAVYFSNVKSNEVGNYYVIYEASSESGGVSYKTVTVEVTNKDIDIDPKLIADDTEISVDSTISTDDELVDILDALAYDHDLRNIHNKIEVYDKGELSYEDKKVGTYEIILGVVGDSGATIYKTVNLQVVDTNDVVSNADIIGNSPVYINSNDTSLNNVHDIISPKSSESTDYEVFRVTNLNTSDFSSFIEGEDGSYIYIYDTITANAKNVSGAFEVYVGDVESTSVVEITAEENLTIDQYYEWDNFTTPDAEAISNNDGASIITFEVYAGKVNSEIPGVYELTYFAQDSFDAYAYYKINVTVLDNGVEPPPQPTDPEEPNNPVVPEFPTDPDEPSDNILKFEDIFSTGSLILVSSNSKNGDNEIYYNIEDGLYYILDESGNLIQTGFNYHVILVIVITFTFLMLLSIRKKH